MEILRMSSRTQHIAAMLLAAAVMIPALAQQNEAPAQTSSGQVGHPMAHQMGEMHHGAAAKRLKVAVLLYEGVEEIDYAGPIEVFGASGFDVFTVAQTRAPVASVYGLQLLPDHDFSDAPAADVLLVPGGGIKLAWKNPVLLAWIRQRSSEVKIVMSVCSGAFILGKAGLLDGVASTTTRSMRDQLAKNFPGTQVRSTRYVDAGKVITTAGISAGIDGALHLVARELGEPAAQATAGYMEYQWKPSPQDH
jgi:transcriptional regulator GlxA family with amidase domain